MFGQQFGFSPGAVPNQQARLAELQQYQMQQQMAQTMPYSQAVRMPMQGRLVASIEEAKVAPVPPDGSSIFFPCPSEQKIYVKSMDINGNSIFETYTLVRDTETKPCYAEVSALESLQARVLELENKLKGTGEND